MIIETNVVTVDPAQCAAFEAAFAAAAPILRTARGCDDVALLRCVDRVATYQVRVAWRTLADHVDRYPASDAAARVRAMLARFIRSADMAHYEQVALA